MRSKAFTRLSVMVQRVSHHVVDFWRELCALLEGRHVYPIENAFRSNVDPNNVPLASLVAQEENVDVNFIKNNNFNNNAYRNNSGNNYRPYPSTNGNGYGNSYGNSYNNNRSVPSGLEAMLKEFISTQTAFNKSVEEKLDKIDTIASRVDRLASDVNLLKLKVMPNNDLDNKITTTANAIQSIFWASCPPSLNHTARTAVRKVAARKTLKRQNPTPAPENLHGYDLSSLLTFDPESIEPAASKASEESGPSATHGQLQHLTALLSSSIETLVEDTEEVKSILEDIQTHLPVTLQVKLWPVVTRRYRSRVKSARQRIGLHHAQLPLKADIEDNCQRLNEKKAALDAKTDTSVSTAELETLRKELEDLEERLVTGQDEDDEAEIAEVDRVRVTALRALEAFLR
ncbi:hypothetical protein QYE76_070376 [Lolium multiflorum]|uniref:Uncharacterized protein n=1 Tax=Lolium multiflorum TaxID=4521 RepID=A0AAD8SJH4_LOLMU|nr:hypothetical protein QYE76_070376 [Lolium multiflorum]